MVVGAIAAFVVVMCGLRSATEKLNASRKHLNDEGADEDGVSVEEESVGEEDEEPFGFSNVIQFYDELDKLCSKRPNRATVLKPMQDIILFLEDGCTAEGSQSVQDLWVMILSAANSGALSNFPRSTVEEGLLEELQRTGIDRDRTSQAMSSSASLLEILFQEEQEVLAWKLS